MHPVGSGGDAQQRLARASGSVAVLFDGDNVAPAKAGAVLASAAQLGSLRIARAYGDWFRPQLAGWRHAMIAHGIVARQVMTVTPGKNTVDHAIVADAIRLVHETEVNTVVIVSSDSDFVDLALQLREMGCTVHGYGERRTARAMIAACDRFVYLEDLTARAANAPAGGVAAPVESAAKASTKPKAQSAAKATPKRATAPAKAAKAAKAAKSSKASDDWAAPVREVVTALSKGDGGAELATVCHRMHAQGITARLPEKAQAKPGRFLTTCGLFEVVKTKGPNGRPAHTYLRNKPAAPAR